MKRLSLLPVTCSLILASCGGDDDYAKKTAPSPSPPSIIIRNVEVHTEPEQPLLYLREEYLFPETIDKMLEGDIPHPITNDRVRERRLSRQRRLVPLPPPWPHPSIGNR